jgi:hypothetical protein
VLAVSVFRVVKEETLPFIPGEESLFPTAKEAEQSSGQVYMI